MTVIAVADLVADVRMLLADPAGSVYGDTDCLRAINAAQRQIVQDRPDSLIIDVNVQLVQGPLQTLPNTVIGMHMPLYNVADSLGTLPVGDFVQQVDWEQLTSVKAGWGSSGADATVQQVAIDRADPRKFWVYPTQPSATTSFLRVKCVANPTAATDATSGNLDFHSQWRNALSFYSCYYLLMRHSFNAAPNTANQFFQSYQMSIGSPSPQNVMPDAVSPPSASGRAPRYGQREAING